MSFKCGIVGLPNVGKSTLFNALTNSSKAQAANFPFCTIDPNVGVVPVPDERLNNLSKVSKSKKIINTTISFVDIAGLVKGASKGEGLGNKFLSHIRERDSITVIFLVISLILFLYILYQLFYEEVNQSLFFTSENLVSSLFKVQTIS